MYIWILDGSKSYLETGEPSYETIKLLEEARIHTPDVAHIHISHLTIRQQKLYIGGVPLDRYPDLVLPRNMDLNTAIRPLPVLRVLEKQGSVCMNSREGMGRAANKIVMGRWLTEAGLPYPETIDFAHKTDPEVIKAHLQHKGALFLKQAKGAEGSGVAYCRTIEEFNEAKAIFRAQNPGNPLLAQEAITTSLDRDVRVFVIGDKIVATMLRRAGREGEVRANYSLGGSIHAIDLPEQAQQLSIKALKALRLDYGGVDLLFFLNSEFILGEVNRTADWSAMEEREAITQRLIKRGIKLVQHGR